jgi:hypothetical protein
MHKVPISQHIDLIEKCSKFNWDEIDIDANEELLSDFSLALYYVRKNLNFYLTNINYTYLVRLAHALQALKNNLEKLPYEALEEIEMYFYYERITDKVKELRDVYWDELLFEEI